MDKILSARVSESVANRIGSLARRLNTSKKKVIETAIEKYADEVDEQQDGDVFEQTCGAWQREDSADQIVESARNAFRASMRRHQA